MCRPMKPFPTEIALVVPVFNEAALLPRTLPQMLAQVRQDLPGVQVTLIAVDDGSRDDTRLVLHRLARTEPALRHASFTRNFGKEAAIQAGLQLALDQTRAQAIVVLDADLQHPPALIAAMVHRWREGFGVAEAVKRQRPRDEGGVRRIAARVFYGSFSRWSGLDLEQATDFKLLDREVALSVVAMQERLRFFRGIVRWLGHPAARIEFDVPDRAGGQTAWSLSQLARYAWRNLSAFSSAPMRVVTWIGAVGLVIGGVLGAKAIVDKYNGVALSGFSTVILLQIIFSSLILVSLGIIGHYIALIYDEIKGRPHYVIRPESSTPAQDDTP